MNENECVALLAKKKDWTDYKVERKSDKPYDLRIEGFDNQMKCCFSAWFPLACIRSLIDWTKPNIAKYTDYPDMCMEGDWSGVRDSSEEKIWLIFEKFILKNNN